MPDPLPEYKRLALGQQRKDLLQEYQAASKQLSQALGAVEQEKIKRQIAHLEEQIQEIERQLGTPPAPVEADEVHSTPPTDGKPSLEPVKEPQPGAKPVTPSTPDVAAPKSGLGGWFSRLPDAGKAAVITGVFAVIVALITLLAQIIPPPNGPASAATPTPMAYVVRIEGQDSAGTGIKDAKVTLEVPGRPPLDTFTDSTGVAVLTVPAQYIGGQAVMIVEAAGFAPFRQNIAIDAGSLPPLVRLERPTQP